MKKVFHLAEIISSMLTGEITPEQQKELDDWERESEENAGLLNNITRGEAIRNNRERLESFDKAAGWQKVCGKCGIESEQHLRRKEFRIGGVWKYVAAVLVLAFGVGIWMQRTPLPMEAELVKEESVKSEIVEVKGVRLRLASGEEVDLEKNNGNVKVTDEGSVASNTGSLLSYLADKNDRMADTVYNEIVVPKGAEFQLKLSDGTLIYLNSMSKIRYPVTFPADRRRVELEGEAFFEVAKDADRPFIVKVQQMEVKVLGTKFNISSYADDGLIQTTLVEGSVEVSSKENRVKAVLKPSEQLCFDKESKTAEVAKVDVSYYTAWRNGWYKYRDIRLEELMKVMMRWYDMDVVYVDPEVKEYLFGCNFSRMNSVESLIRVFEENGKVKIERVGNILTIRKGR